MRVVILWVLGLAFVGEVAAQAVEQPAVQFGPYEYEAVPDDPAFRGFRPRKAPAVSDQLLLEKGDRLAICGDSITEQQMYSRIIETYLTACVPQLQIRCRQFGWSGEKTDGFLRRMERDCLTFRPTVATTSYGMNDSRYRPFDITNGQWYEDHYAAIVRKFKAAGVRVVVVGSPGCAGRIADWVKSRAGSLEQHNVHLCALRDIAIGVADKEEMPFADIFWPMFQAQIFAPGQHGATEERPYRVAGADGIHPGWAGHTMMAYAYLRALGLDGDIGTISVDLGGDQAFASDGHRIDSWQNRELKVTSERYPFCAAGDPDSENSIRSGMTLVPFAEDLNRFRLVVRGGAAPRYRVTWGKQSREFSAEQLQVGVALPDAYPENPFSEAFSRVDRAVAAKQEYEREQVKKAFHGKRAKSDFAAVVSETEAVRKPLADAIAAAMVPVTHTFRIDALE